MKIQDVKVALDTFQGLFPGPVPFELEYSPPWHFHEAVKLRVPFEHDRGIYLYSKPSSPDWHLPIGQNDSPVWYIGMSNSAIAGRVWSHMGLIYEPGTSQRPAPPFKYHQWAQLESFPPEVVNAVANGDIVV